MTTTATALKARSSTRATTMKAIVGLLPLRAGVMESGDRVIALNRPAGEDSVQTLSASSLNELFDGLDYRRIDDTLDSRKKLTSEIWRMILVLMALALIAEAVLCMPERKAEGAAGTA